MRWGDRWHIDMGTLQRRIGARAIRHAVVESAVHKADVAENNRRRSLYWLGVEQGLEDGHHEIPQLGGGLYFVRDRATGQFQQVGGADLIAKMDDWVKQKSWYYREITDPKCTGGKRWKKTSSKGVQGMVVSCSPWWSHLIFEAAQNGEAEKIKELSREVARELQATLERQTRRQVLSVQIHFDTVNLHAHVFSTRIGDDHKLLKGTTKRLGLIGPWACGVLRQGDGGAIPRESTNYRTACRLVERNERRTGAAPLDWAMCKGVDAVCLAMFGASPRLTFWMRVYAQGLPALCFTRLLALQTAVGREVEIWQRHVSRHRDYAPAAVAFGRAVNGGREVQFN